MPARRHRLLPPTTVGRVIAGALALLTAIGGVTLAATAASAAPAYEITGQWAPGTPVRTANGNLVTAVWRVNVNDDANPPANDPVDNVTFSVTVQHGKFAALPSPCQTTGVTPASSISADGATLMCNLGTQKEGTADVVQAPMVVNGLTGDQISASATIGGHTADVPPIPIHNAFAEDMLWGTPSNYRAYTSPTAGTDAAFALEWTLRTSPGSDPGPTSVSYNLTITSNTNRNLTVGAPYVNRTTCTAYNYGNTADGHPFSGRPTLPDQNAPFVQTCTLTKLTATTFRLTLSGIDYSKTQLPSKDSAGAALPPAWQPVASGSIWLTAHNLQSETSVTLRSNAPTYRSPSGATSTDAAGNNTSTKAIPLPGNWSAAWQRAYTHSGGTAWDDSYDVPQGTDVEAQVTDRYGEMPAATVPNNTVLGECSVLDVKYVTFSSLELIKYPPGDGTNTSPITGAALRYYAGNSALLNPNSPAYNPDAFDCGTAAGWTTTKPANGQIKAVRATWRKSAVVGSDVQLRVIETVHQNAPINQDVWMWGSTFQGWASNQWNNPGRGTADPPGFTPVPGSRYHYTDGARDVLHVTGPIPSVTKTAGQKVITPGVPVTYTLHYQLQGAGSVPGNGYRLVDTLPVGLTYVAGSATPAPTVNGRTLTWVYNGVPLNTQQTQTYQAVAADSVTAGQALTNTVTATYGQERDTASAQVTVSTSGYTTLLKTSDLQYIPNLHGDGSGTDSWTVTLTSADPLPQPFTDTIDILPYNGDGRGTSFSGTYTLGTVVPPTGGTVYYTTADRTTLNDDPGDPSNGHAGSITGNTVGWSTTYTAAATAVRVIGPQLAPGATQQFKVPITTAGAHSGDVYVNRAQARAGHTELVMRTSAKMTMAQYYAATLKKYVQDVNGDWHDANGAADYPAFHYGDTIHYRVVVTNVGEGTLTDLDISDDKQPQLGAFHVDSLASGQSQTHEYSITLDTSVSGTVVNNACATAATPPDMTTPPDIPCDPAGLEVTNYTVVKTADPASGTPVAPGDVIHYTITVTQQGSAPADAMYSDDLSKLLDDADYGNDVAASIGTATYQEPIISWTGTVPVGQVATITYSVKVHDVAGLQGGGDTDLVNTVTSPGCIPPGTGCTTDHKTGYYTYSKVADPKSGSSVGIGDKITYTVTIVQHGEGPVAAAAVDDDLTKVLDDATYDGDAKASAGAVTYAEPTLTWTGDLAVGQTVTLTYSATATGHGDRDLHNVVTAPPGKPGACDTSVGCDTEHQLGDYTYSKVADPKSGSTVHVGDKITYTVAITEHGPGAVAGAVLTDDLTQVLDDAGYDNDAHPSSGDVTYAAPKLTWKGDLAVGQTVTITYSVTVNGNGDGKLANVVTSPDPRGTCDRTVGCRTGHHLAPPPAGGTTPPPAGGTTPPPAAPPASGSGGLAYTGNDTRLELILTGLLLAAGGLLTTLGTRRRRGAA